MNNNSKIIIISLFLGFGSLWAGEEPPLTVTARVEVVRASDGVPGRLQFWLLAEIISPEERKGEIVPNIYFLNLDEMKKITGDWFSTNDVISFQAPKDFFERAKGHTLRLNELKDFRVVKRCPPSERPKAISKPPQNKQSVQEKDKGSTASKEAGPLPPPPGWPTGSKQEPPSKSTDASESQPANKEPAGK